MESVYEAENTVEAHMVIHMLESEGISARVLGEHLQGGVGELPAHGNVRVAVEPEDVAEARRLIREWESSNIQSSPAVSSAPPVRGNPFSTLLGFIAGAGLASAFLLWVYNSPVKTFTADYNRDGEIDEWAHWRSERVSRVDVDRNFDGEVDGIIHYSRRNSAERAEYDDNFDGVFELQSEFRYTQPYIDTIDTDGDGIADRRYRYRDGVLQYLDMFRPKSTVIRKTNVYSYSGVLVEAQWDADNDGRLDTLILYGPYEEELSREPLPVD